MVQDTDTGVAEKFTKEELDEFKKYDIEIKGVNEDNIRVYDYSKQYIAKLQLLRKDLKIKTMGRSLISLSCNIENILEIRPSFMCYEMRSSAFNTITGGCGILRLDIDDAIIDSIRGNNKLTNTNILTNTTGNILFSFDLTSVKDRNNLDIIEKCLKVRKNRFTFVKCDDLEYSNRFADIFWKIFINKLFEYILLWCDNKVYINKLVDIIKKEISLTQSDDELSRQRLIYRGKTYKLLSCSIKDYHFDATPVLDSKLGRFINYQALLGCTPSDIKRQDISKIYVYMEFLCDDNDTEMFELEHKLFTSV
jgi:hypothetical protein